MGSKVRDRGMHRSDLWRESGGLRGREEDKFAAADSGKSRRSEVISTVYVGSRSEVSKGPLSGETNHSPGME